jgi:inhibitor of KinA
MRIRSLGDSAWLLSELPGPAFAAARSLRELQLDGVLDVVSAYDTLALYVDPFIFEPEGLEEYVAQKVVDTGRAHRIPVCYELGHDLREVAEFFALTTDQVADIHCSQSYTCYAVGFQPGFGYLGHLDSRLTGMPRLDSPRIRVESGSVGLTGSQTGVYPSETPGGWRIIGRTPLTMVDPIDDYYPLSAGDLVEFFRITEGEFNQMVGERL